MQPPSSNSLIAFPYWQAAPAARPHSQQGGHAPAFAAASGGRIPCGSTKAFTLLEVLLCIALIALLAGVLIGGSAHLLSERRESMYDVFWKTVQEARKTALQSERDIRLQFDQEKKAFVLVDGLAPARLAEDGFTHEEVPLKAFPIADAAESDLEINFLSANKGGPTILVGGVLLEAQPIPFVTFYPDGTCTAFRTQFLRNGSARTLQIDPWTCAPVLTPADPNAPPAF